MRVLQEAYFTVPIRDIRDNPSTPLDKAQTKPRRRPRKYRAVERPDGIIVERPRYRPTALAQKGKPKPNHTVVVPKIPTKQTGDVKSSRMTYDLLGIGISETNSGNVNHDGSTEETRRGQGFIQYQHIHIEIEKYTVEQHHYTDKSPIDRFLRDREPWSSYSPYSQREAE